MFFNGFRAATKKIISVMGNPDTKVDSQSISLLASGPARLARSLPLRPSAARSGAVPLELDSRPSTPSLILRSSSHVSTTSPTPSRSMASEGKIRRLSVDELCDKIQRSTTSAMRRTPATDLSDAYHLPPHPHWLEPNSPLSELSEGGVFVPEKSIREIGSTFENVQITFPFEIQTSAGVFPIDWNTVAGCHMFGVESTQEEVKKPFEDDGEQRRRAKKHSRLNSKEPVIVGGAEPAPSKVKLRIPGITAFGERVSVHGPSVPDDVRGDAEAKSARQAVVTFVPREDTQRVAVADNAMPRPLTRQLTATDVFQVTSTFKTVVLEIPQFHVEAASPVRYTPVGRANQVVRPISGRDEPVPGWTKELAIEGESVSASWKKEWDM